MWQQNILVLGKWRTTEKKKKKKKEKKNSGEILDTWAGNSSDKQVKNWNLTKGFFKQN